MNKLLVILPVIALLATASVAYAWELPNPCDIIPELCTPHPCDIEDTDVIEECVEPTPTPSETPTGPGDESSTQDTRCDDLASLTEEQALNDCGESKTTPTPTVEPSVQPEPTVTPVEPTPTPVLEVFPSTGIDLLGSWY